MGGIRGGGASTACALRMRTARARHTRWIRTPCAPSLSPPASPDPDPDPDPAPEAEQVRQSFEAYDTSGAGRLSPADAEAALGAVGLQLAPGRAAYAPLLCMPPCYVCVCVRHARSHPSPKSLSPSPTPSPSPSPSLQPGRVALRRQLTQLLELHGGAQSAQSGAVTLDEALGVLALILEG